MHGTASVCANWSLADDPANEQVIDESLFREELGREAHEPTPATLPEASREGLLLDAVLPPEIRSLFSYGRLNYIQSQTFEKMFHSDAPVVVSAPTGCGKTVLFELAIARLLHKAAEERRSLESAAAPPAGLEGHGKVVYLAPVRALCDEKVAEWSRQFESAGVRVKLLTGDAGNDDLSDSSLGFAAQVADADILCATPEKWDSLTRRWADNLGLIGQIALLLIDEVHTLNEPRGATLEAIVARMHAVKHHPQVLDKGWPATRLRCIALSATLPNLDDVAEWLDAPEDCRFAFGPEHRPVPLETYVLGFPEGSNSFLFNKFLHKRVAPVVQRFGRQRPALVFCVSRRAAVTCAEEVANFSGDSASATAPRGRGRGRGRSGRAGLGTLPTSPWLLTQLSAEQRSALDSAAASVEDAVLRELLPKGVAFHHAGLSASDRKLVEQMFRSRSLPVLCTTTTLAVGVNLPAHLVVINSTTAWRGAGEGYQDLSRGAILQMIGRAGRPQYDDTGVAVILTQQSRREHFARLVSGAEVIESHLHVQLTEHLNAEIALGTLSSLDDAVEWMRRTFLYVRAHRDPLCVARFAEGGSAAGAGGPSVDALLQNLVIRHATRLIAARMVELLPAGGEQGERVPPSCCDGDPPGPTSAGLQDRLRAGATWRARSSSVVMARYYLRFATAVALLRLPPASAAERLLWTLSHTPEFESIVLRRTDKAPLNALNAGKVIGVRFPVRGRVQTAAAKVFLLLQAQIGRSPLGAARLEAERTSCADIAHRLLRGVIALLASEDVRHPATMWAHALRRCLERRTWDPRVASSRTLRPGLGRSLRDKAAAEAAAADGCCEVRQLASIDGEPWNVATVQQAEQAGYRSLDAIMKAPTPALVRELPNVSSSALATWKESVRSTPRWVVTAHVGGFHGQRKALRLVVRIVHGLPWPSESSTFSAGTGSVASAGQITAAEAARVAAVHTGGSAFAKLAAGTLYLVVCAPSTTGLLVWEPVRHRPGEIAVTIPAARLLPETLSQQDGGVPKRANVGETSLRVGLVHDQLLGWDSHTAVRVRLPQDVVDAAMSSLDTVALAPIRIEQRAALQSTPTPLSGPAVLMGASASDDIDPWAAGEDEPDKENECRDSVGPCEPTEHSERTSTAPVFPPPPSSRRGPRQLRLQDVFQMYQSRAADTGRLAGSITGSFKSRSNARPARAPPQSVQPPLQSVPADARCASHDRYVPQVPPGHGDVTHVAPTRSQAPWDDGRAPPPPPLFASPRSAPPRPPPRPAAAPAPPRVIPHGPWDMPAGGLFAMSTPDATAHRASGSWTPASPQTVPHAGWEPPRRPWEAIETVWSRDRRDPPSPLLPNDVRAWPDPLAVLPRHLSSARNTFGDSFLNDELAEAIGLPADEAVAWYSEGSATPMAGMDREFEHQPPPWSTFLTPERPSSKPLESGDPWGSNQLASHLPGGDSAGVQPSQVPSQRLSWTAGFPEGAHAGPTSQPLALRSRRRASPHRDDGPASAALRRVRRRARQLWEQPESLGPGSGRLRRPGATMPPLRLALPQRDETSQPPAKRRAPSLGSPPGFEPLERNGGRQSPGTDAFLAELFD